jgi:LysR family hydrogen peroxide-inducible transcriptional activator
MTLIVEENYTEVLTERLKSGALDVADLSLPYNEPGISTYPLYDEPFVVLLPSGHPLAQESRISPDRLSEETVLLLGKGHCFRDQVLAFCPQCRKRATDDDLQRALEGGSLETIRYMVASGAGVTILPCTAAGADRYSQRLLTIRRFEGIQPSRRVVLAWRNSFTRARAGQTVIEAILACGQTCVRRLQANPDLPAADLPIAAV